MILRVESSPRSWFIELFTSINFINAAKSPNPVNRRAVRHYVQPRFLGGVIFDGVNALLRGSMVLESSHHTREIAREAHLLFVWRFWRTGFRYLKVVFRRINLGVEARNFEVCKSMTRLAAHLFERGAVVLHKVLTRVALYVWLVVVVRVEMLRFGVVERVAATFDLRQVH
jgi:hypothetical protein